jgi:signal transduction histidine kinase
LPLIFERMYRADRARSPETGGAGLGLSIAQRIVELHGGRIDVETALNQGSTFTIRLPQK